MMIRYGLQATYCLVLLAATHSSLLKPLTIEGPVIYASVGRLSIKPWGEETNLAVAGSPVVFLDGSPASLDQLQSTDLATVSARRTDNGWVVTRVVARSSSPSMTPLKNSLIYRLCNGE